MASKKYTSERRRSREITKKKKTDVFKKNKMIAILVILGFVFASIVGAYFVLMGDEEENPIAVIDTSKGVIKIELYIDEMPITCQNFIDLANDGFYDGMIVHRVQDGFMIQSGKMLPDETIKNSPYGDIVFEESDVPHVDGAISMASSGDQVGGSAEFFICDGEQTGLDGRYAAFGKTIQGIEIVREIADEPHDSSFGSVGGGRPINEDIIINSITIVYDS